MPNIFHQSVEDIFKAATPEQKILWNYIFLRWGERIAISQVYFTGVFAGTEFSVYAANKLYVALQMEVTYGSVNGTPAGTGINVYNEANALFYNVFNNSSYWDVTAAAQRNSALTVYNKNIYFSRLSLSSGTYLKFIGYRIGI